MRRAFSFLFKSIDKKASVFGGYFPIRICRINNYSTCFYFGSSFLLDLTSSTQLRIVCVSAISGHLYPYLSYLPCYALSLTCVQFLGRHRGRSHAVSCKHWLKRAWVWRWQIRGMTQPWTWQVGSTSTWLQRKRLKFSENEEGGNARQNFLSPL